MDSVQEKYQKAMGELLARHSAMHAEAGWTHTQSEAIIEGAHVLLALVHFEPVILIGCKTQGGAAQWMNAYRSVQEKSFRLIALCLFDPNTPDTQEAADAEASRCAAPVQELCLAMRALENEMQVEAGRPKIVLPGGLH